MHINETPGPKFRNNRNLSGASWGKETCKLYDAFDSNLQGTVILTQSLKMYLPTVTINSLRVSHVYRLL